MTKTLHMMTAALMLSATALAPAAFAQTAPSGAGTPPAQGMGTSGTVVPDATSPSGTSTGQVQPGAAGTSDTAEVPATYLTGQADDQYSATNFIGQTVYNAADESVGSISDLILDADRRVVAAVIGVGGFLGIGTKDVAVPVDSIQVHRAEDGTLKLTTLETADSLRDAPEFEKRVTQ